MKGEFVSVKVGLEDIVGIELSEVLHISLVWLEVDSDKDVLVDASE